MKEIKKGQLLDMKKLRILIPMLSFGRAGGIRVLSQLSNKWIELGHTVCIVSHFESEDIYYPTKANIIWINDQGEEVDINRAQVNTKNIGLKKMYGIYNYLRKESSKYDVVLANHNLTAWPVALGSKAQNYYYIQAYEVEFISKKNIKGLLKQFSAWLTYFLPLIKVVNADVYRNFKNIKSDYVIPAGLDLNTYYPIKNDKQITNKDFTIGCIGRQAEWKGSNDVGDAVKILRSKGYKVDFKVAFERIKYKEHELVKPDGDDNLAQFYRDLDVLVAPGHIQLGAIHYPVIEAMACKTPVITTGYYPANTNNAFIVPIKRPDRLAETLSYIIDNYDDAIKKAELAYEDIKEFDWQIVSTNFLNIFMNGSRED